MAGTQGIRAGGAFIQLNLQDNTGRALNAAGRRFRTWGQTMTRSLSGLKKSFGTGLGIGAGFAAATVAIKAFTMTLQGMFNVLRWGFNYMANAVNVAGDMEESMNVFDVAFGESAKSVKQWADEYGSAIGRSKKFMVDTAASFRYFAGQLGYTGDAADEMAKDLTALSIDLGSFWNMADSDVAWRLRSALQGNYEAVRLLNINLSDKTILEYAKNMGIAASELTLAQKRAIAYNVIVEQTRDVQGDAAKTITSYKNSLKVLNAQLEDMALLIGQALMPYVKQATGILMRLVIVLAEEMPNIMRKVGEVFQTIGAYINGFAEGLMDTYITFLSSTKYFTQAVVMMFGDMAQGILKVTSFLIENLGEGFAKVVGVMTFNLRLLVNGIARAMEALGMAQAESLRQFSDTLTEESINKRLGGVKKWADGMNKAIEDGFMVDAIGEGFNTQIGKVEEFRDKIRRSGLGGALMESLMDSFSGGRGAELLDFILNGKLPAPAAEQIDKVALPGAGGEAGVNKTTTAGALSSPSSMFRSSTGIQSKIYDIQQKHLQLQQKILEETAKTADNTEGLPDLGAV